MPWIRNKNTGRWNSLYRPVRQDAWSHLSERSRWSFMNRRAKHHWSAHMSKFRNVPLGKGRRALDAQAEWRWRNRHNSFSHLR